MQFSLKTANLYRKTSDCSRLTSDFPVYSELMIPQGYLKHSTLSLNNSKLNFLQRKMFIKHSSRIIKARTNMTKTTRSFQKLSVLKMAKKTFFGAIL